MAKRKQGHGKKVRPFGSVGPTTLMGQFLRATIMRWEEERLRLWAEVKKTGSKDGNEVTRAAFEVGVRRIFTSDTDLREISDLVERMREAFGDVPVLETEAFIREALGEDVATADIGLREEILAKGLTLMAIADLWSRDERRVNELLFDAEKLVWARGFSPVEA